MNVTNAELNEKMARLVREERRIAGEILQLINLADRRRLHLELGFGSLFDWLVRGHGYSESAAQRRIQAARLLRAVPEAAEKVQTGELNLTTLAKAQSAIWAEEKRSGARLPSETKADVVRKIEGKSSVETDRVLVSTFPEIQSNLHQPRATVVNADTMRLAFNLSNESVKELERVKELVSHIVPSGQIAEVFAYLIKEYLKRKDPLQTEYKKTIAAAKKRSVVSAQVIPYEITKRILNPNAQKLSFS